MNSFQRGCLFFCIVSIHLFWATSLQFAQTSVVIFAIYPNNAISPGAEFVIKGHGFKGRSAIWLADVHGPSSLIGTVESSDDLEVRAKLPSLKLCSEDTHGPCPRYLTIEPRGYRIYVSNENGASNKVLVAIRQSPSMLVIKEPRGKQQWTIGTIHRISWNGPNRGTRYQFSVESASAPWKMQGIAPPVVGKHSINWTAGTMCGLKGCWLDTRPSDYYIVVDDPESGIQTWSSEPITLVP